MGGPLGQQTGSMFDFLASLLVDFGAAKTPAKVAGVIMALAAVGIFVVALVLAFG